MGRGKGWPNSAHTSHSPPSPVESDSLGPALPPTSPMDRMLKYLGGIFTRHQGTEMPSFTALGDSASGNILH